MSLYRHSDLYSVIHESAYAKAVTDTNLRALIIAVAKTYKIKLPLGMRRTHMSENLCDIIKEHKEGLISLRMAILKVERYTGDGVAGDKDATIYVLEPHAHLHAKMKERWYGISGSVHLPPLDEPKCPSDRFHSLTAPRIMVTNEGEAERAVAALSTGSTVTIAFRRLGDYAKPRMEVGAIGLATGNRCAVIIFPHSHLQPAMTVIKAICKKQIRGQSIRQTKEFLSFASLEFDIVDYGTKGAKSPTLGTLFARIKALHCNRHRCDILDEPASYNRSAIDHLVSELIGLVRC